MMLLLHVMSWMLNTNALFATVDNIPLANILAMLVFEFMGGLAGFFLLVSAIGNMISMYKRLQAGRSTTDLLRNQVVSGILLLIFAYLVEGDIGYRGALGNVLRSLNNIPSASVTIATMFSRWAYFETIHTIAWCILINGIVQYVLSRHDRWKDVKGQIIAYAVAAVIVVLITQPVWWLVQNLVPGGYPWTAAGNDVSLPDILSPGTTFVTLLHSVFLNALAAPEEPILPYLAISFLGSIIGIVLSQPREKIPLNFPKRIMQLGMAMFVVGMVGFVAFIVTVLTQSGFDAMATAYFNVSNHRNLWDYPGIPQTYTFPAAWLFQFLAVNGIGVLLTMLVIRLVEFRGFGAKFAKQTTFIRRFGFIAFTNYNDQFIMWIVWYLYGTVASALGLGILVGVDPTHVLPNGSYSNPYEAVNWTSVFIILFLVYCLYHVIMIAWEKVGYIGSLEWCMVRLSYALVPSKKATGSRLAGTGRGAGLDVEHAFYNAEWQDIVQEGEVPAEEMRDSKLAYKLALIGLVSVVFIPVTIVSWRLALTAERVEGKNKYNHIAKIASIAGIVILVAVLAFLFIFTPNMLGLSF